MQQEAARVAGPNDDSFTDARILCVPLRDQADATAAQMLAQLLAADGFHVHTDAPDALTGEVLDRVAKLASDVVVISILPPIAPRDSRLLWKRLRHRYPNLPIIVGYWNAQIDRTTRATRGRRTDEDYDVTGRSYRPGPLGRGPGSSDWKHRGSRVAIRRRLKSRVYM